MLEAIFQGIIMGLILSTFCGPIFFMIINLGITNPADYGVWKKFSLDLGTLIISEPGAIYKLDLIF